MSPRVCPQPPDCGLFDQRALTADEQLRRAVLHERHKTRTLASLVWADLNRGAPRAVLPAATELLSGDLLHSRKGATS